MSDEILALLEAHHEETLELAAGYADLVWAYARYIYHLHGLVEQIFRIRAGSLRSEAKPAKSEAVSPDPATSAPLSGENVSNGLRPVEDVLDPKALAKIRQMGKRRRAKVAWMKGEGAPLPSTARRHHGEIPTGKLVSDGTRVIREAGPR